MIHTVPQQKHYDTQEVKCLRIDLIKDDGSTLPRTHLDQEIIAHYCRDIDDGLVLPPIECYFDGRFYWLFKGHHIFESSLRSKLLSVDAILHNGSLEEARWESYKSIYYHDQSKTGKDRRLVIERVLRHPNSSRLSDHQIARHVGCSHTTIGRWRKNIRLS